MKLGQLLNYSYVLLICFTYSFCNFDERLLVVILVFCAHITL